MAQIRPGQDQNKHTKTYENSCIEARYRLSGHCNRTYRNPHPLVHQYGQECRVSTPAQGAESR